MKTTTDKILSMLESMSTRLTALEDAVAKQAAAAQAAHAHVAPSPASAPSARASHTASVPSTTSATAHSSTLPSSSKQTVQQTVISATSASGTDAHSGITCVNCGKGDTSGCCARCNFARYCRVDCQRMDWPDHQRVCQQLGVLSLQHAPQPPPLSFLLSLTSNMEQVYAAKFSTWVRANYNAMLAAAEEDEELHMNDGDESEESEDSDDGAGDNGDFDGPRLVVAGRGRGRAGGVGPSSILPGQANIWIGNMPPNITETKLTSIFSTYGPVTRVSITKSRRVSSLQDPTCFPGIGFVRMEDKDAIRAILALDDSRPFPGQTKPLDVRVARSDPPALKRLAPLIAAAKKEGAASPSHGHARRHDKYAR